MVNRRVLVLLIVVALAVILSLFRGISTGAIPGPEGTRSIAAGILAAGKSAANGNPDGARPAVDRPQPRNFLLVGWDGADRRRVEQAMAAGDLPVISSLAQGGSFVPIEIRGATDSAAGWAQALTGYDPDITGVYSNSQVQPIPKEYTLFERLRTHSGAKDFAAAAVISVDHPLLSEMPLMQLPRLKPGSRPGIVDRMIDDILAGYGLNFGRLYFDVRDSVDIYVSGFGDDPAALAREAGFLDRYEGRPFFIFFHILAPDHWGHNNGEDSPEYYNALVGADKVTGALVDKLKEQGIYDQTLVYVTADHGFDEGQKTHDNAPYVFLATNDVLAAESGDRADIAPTILDRMGVDLAAIDPPLSGHSLLRADEPPAE
ncbi:MAG: alkaline phosphatase family protein [Bacteroidetes bacterium]|nr:alkaline phosphatase family protein [Bacteroidota bacterium]MCL5025792.1 alkaline phosphatase family protein [Chloroflexota bacterium]